MLAQSEGVMRKGFFMERPETKRGFKNTSQNSNSELTT